MKRKLIIISTLIITLTSFYLFIGSKEITTFGLNEIVIESLEEAESSFSISKEDEMDFDYFIDLINHSEKSRISETNIEPNYQVKFRTQNKEKNYLVTIDVSNKNLMIYDFNKDYTFSIDQKDAEHIMLHPAFSSAYPHSTAPKLTLGDGQSTVSLTESFIEWNYKKIDNQWYKSDYKTTFNENDEPFLINQSDQFLSASFEVEPELLTYAILDKDTLLYEHPLAEGGIPPYKEDGIKTFVIKAQWPETADQEFYGSATYTFDVDTDLPASLEFNESNLQIGGAFKILVNNLDPGEKPFLSQKILGSFQFYKTENETIGFLPASYHTKAGNYPLEFWTETDKGIKSDSIEYVLDVNNRNFNIQQLTISTSTVKATRNDEAYSQFAKYFNPARETSVAEKLWEGPFIKPVEGRTSTTYGERRYVNNAPTSYRHSGMDIATPRGTPIMATNSGRVQLAMNLILTGNTIVIDHGLGIFSVYFHCDSLNVEEGQMVKKSDIIAEVGSTGFSTGPHLHWTMSIFDQNIDPEWVIGNEF